MSETFKGSGILTPHYYYIGTLKLSFHNLVNRFRFFPQPSVPNVGNIAHQNGHMFLPKKEIKRKRKKEYIYPINRISLINSSWIDLHVINATLVLLLLE